MQNSLAGAGKFPMLSKKGVAIGLFCIVPGAFWERCPESDKEKKYKEFVGMHTFGPAAGRSWTMQVSTWHQHLHRHQRAEPE